MTSGNALLHETYSKGVKDTEEKLIPLINDLCEAILFDNENKVQIAREILIQIHG